MKDIVRHFEEISQANGWIYTYGTMSALNLKMNKPHAYDTDGNVILDESIYMLAEPTVRRYGMSTGGNSNLSTVSFTGAVMIVQQSKHGMPYFAEQNTDPALYEAQTSESKYAIHVEPLLNLVAGMIKYFVCQDLSIISWEVVDWIDYLDENRDGIMIRYVIQYEY